MPVAYHIRQVLALVFAFNLAFLTRAQPGSISQALDQLQHVLGGSIGDLETGKNLNNARPFYAIAHRVLTVGGARDAAEHGANAIEIDMYAWSAGWWADHNGTPTSYGDTAEDMFKSIANLRREGKPILFVWLDIKNPDYCNPGIPSERKCSIDALRDLARLHLEPVGVRVLYGFYGSTVEKPAYRRVFEGLNNNEALNINGELPEVTEAFQRNGEPEKSRRVMSYGYYNLPFEFGNCQEPSYYTCTELRKGAEADSFGQVFGWTAAAGQNGLVDALVSNAGVDGIIYGFQMTYYYDHADTRSAIASIRDAVSRLPGKRYLSGLEDKPW
ncbi:hypothetical protein ACHAPT_013076 [Fusarium lateritium]